MSPVAGSRPRLYLLGPRRRSSSSPPEAPSDDLPTTSTAGRQTEGAFDDELTGLINITENNAVIENVKVDGQLRINADNVTVRNCLVNITEDFHDQPGIWRFSGSGGTFEQNTITGYGSNQAGGSGPANSGISGGSRIYGNLISGCADGIKAGSGAHVEFNYVYQHCTGFINGNLEQPAHCDGIQYQASTGTIIKRNVFVGPIFDGGHESSEGTISSQVNGGIFLKTDSGNIVDVLIEGNQVWGYGNNCYLYATNGRTVEATVINNIFGENDDYALFGPFTLQEIGSGEVNLVQSGNVNELGESVGPS